MVSVYSALCAEKLIFNSRYNKNTFLTGVSELIQKFPDEKPQGFSELLEEKSLTLMVPIVDELYQTKSRIPRQNNTLTLLWNHRWEYDKGPDRLLEFLRLLDKNFALRVHVVGQQFRQQPKEFENILNLLESRGWLGHWGHIPSRDAYIRVLFESDIVISTALHDFQGLSIMEACACGCIPLVPDRMAYRDYIPADYRYTAHEADCKQEAALAVETFLTLQANLEAHKKIIKGHAAEWSWSAQINHYRQVFESLAALEV